MEIKEAEKIIQELRQTIEYHNERYYNEDAPDISDYEYDMLMQRLKSLEKEFPTLQTEGSPEQLEQCFDLELEML